jgi:hypothetical protein
LIGPGGRHEVGAAQQLVLYTTSAGVNAGQHSTALRAEARVRAVAGVAFGATII